MTELQITVRDGAEQRSEDVTVQWRERAPMAEVVEALVGFLGWPRVDAGGKRMRYAASIRKAATGEEQPLDLSLPAPAGVVDGDYLLLSPVTAGYG